MKTLCLTLDLINDICHPNGRIAAAAGRIAEADTIGRANRALRWARERGHAVAHVRVGFGPGYPECPSGSPVFGPARERGALQLGSWGTAFCEALERTEGEPEIVKHRVSAFYGTGLEPLLRARGIGHLVLLGVSTDNAVELTAREAHDRDYRVTVVADACQSANEEAYRGSLRFLARIATLVDAADLDG